MLYWLGTGAGNSALVGGKALGLDRLAQLGLPTPPGFCLTTIAYQCYLEAYGSAERLAVLVAKLPDEAARQELAALAFAHPLPTDLSMVLQDGLVQLSKRLLPASLLAVRSSAVDEDKVTASFAGQYESSIGVPYDRIEAAVRGCWASLWAPGAVTYRLRRGTDLTGAAMAVIVQALVPAEVSAVVFTRNPVNRRDDEMLINATWGLGEAIVSGSVTPDTIVVDKATLQVKSALPGTKHLRIDPQATGGTTTTAIEEAGLAIDEARAAALAALCCQVEQAFGMPMDVEAAFATGQWYLVQARPITTK